MRSLTIGVLLLILLGAASYKAHAAEDWLTVTVASRHHTRGYNERNWGIGFERRVAADLRLLGGTYRNSYWRQTVYAGGAYEPYSWGPWRAGVTGMAVTGYANRPEVIAFPSISYEGREWGFNIGPILPSVVALQVKWRF